MPTMNLVPVTSNDYRRIAERKLPRFLFDYADGGAYGEMTLRNNLTDFSQIVPQQRVMRDVSNVSTAAHIAGSASDMPLALAPVGMAGMFARRAELQAKRAADAAGVPFTLSTVSICSLEEIAGVSDAPFWFQLYMLRDRKVVEEILQRAWDVGVRTLLFTVDLAVVGERYRDVRNGIAGGASAWGRLRAGPLSYVSHPRWLFDVGIRGRPHTFGNLAEYVPAATNPAQYREWVESQFDASVTWKDIEWLRGVWKGKLILKGILSSEDAGHAAAAGADGVVVSNHGGRQLDGVASSISILPEIAETYGDKLHVLMDGGVRSGLDVFRARALGAEGVLIGRPWLFAVSAKGKTGVTNLLGAFKKEMTTTMALCGINETSEIAPELVSVPS